MMPEETENAETTSEEISTKSRSANKKRPAIAVIIVFLLFFTAVIVYGILSTSKPANDAHSDKTPKPNENVNNPPINTPVINDNDILIPYIQNYDDLTISDLPRTNDVRYVGEHNGNQIVVLLDKIVEFNPATNKLIRVSRSSFDCAFTATIIEDILYTACNNPDEFSGPAPFYTINLNTGKLIDFRTGYENYNIVNPQLMSRDGILFIGSWDGVLQIDPEIANDFEGSDSAFTIHAPNELGHTNCDRSNIRYFEQEGEIRSYCVTEQTTSQYYPDTDDWRLLPDAQTDLQEIINLGIKDYALEMPLYFAFSKVINDKRYLISTNGVEILEKYSMPSNFIDTDLYDYYIDDKEFSDTNTLYITADEHFALLVKREIYQGPTEEIGYTEILLFNLLSKTFTDLTESLNKNEMLDLTERMIDSENYTLIPLNFEESGNTIEVSAESTGELFFGINTQSNELTIMTFE